MQASPSRVAGVSMYTPAAGHVDTSFKPTELRRDFFFRRRKGKLDWRKVRTTAVCFPGACSHCCHLPCPKRSWSTSIWRRWLSRYSRQFSCISLDPLCQLPLPGAQVDIDTLQDNVEHITFADLNEDGEESFATSCCSNIPRSCADLRYFTDANFIHLFRLSQV
jgi:hypothetical protein